jgi:hypothetical protein
LSADNFEYWKTQYSGMDQVYYRQMAESAPNINSQIPHFFAYRIFPPWLAGILPGSVESGFKFLNLFFLIAVSYSFYFLLKKIELKELTSLIMTLTFILNRYFFQIHAWNYFQLTDLISNTVIFLSIISIISKRYILLGFLFSIGIMSKETVLVIVPVVLFYLIQSKSKRKDWLYFSLSLLPGIFLFVFLRIFIPTIGEEKLTAQIINESYKYFRIFVWAKVLIVPFIPFSFVPVIFYREFRKFISDNIYLFVLFLVVVLTAMLGFDYERLLSPAAPFLYAFAGIIIEKYFLDNSRILPVMIIGLMVIFNSFYHIAGIIRLPNSKYSLAISVFSLLISTGIFLGVRLKSEKN